MKKNKKRHEKEIHQKREKKFNCGFCGSSFCRRSDLRRHERKYHVNIAKDKNKIGEPKCKYVKIPEYSDISDDEFNWDLNNNKGENNNLSDISENVNMDGERFVNLENEKLKECTREVHIENLEDEIKCDFLDMTENEYEQLRSGLIVQEDVKTVTLTLTKTEQKFLDGSVKVKRESTVGFSENVDKDTLNIRNIVDEVTFQINDFLTSDNVPGTFYTL